MFGDGLKSREQAVSAITALAIRLQGIAIGNHGETDNGYGFTMTAKCVTFKDNDRCHGVCLKDKLQKLGIENKAKITGNCIQEKV